MAISPHVVQLRSKIGSELLLLPSVTVLIRNDRDQILLVRHIGFDRWGTLGGMVEPKEHPRDAAAREAKEETGLDIEITSLLTAVGGPDYEVTYPNGDRVSYVSTVYGAELIGGVAAIDVEELTDMRWFDSAELQTLALDRFAQSLFQELGMIAS